MWIFSFTLFLQLSGLFASYNEGTIKCGAELGFRAVNSTGEEEGSILKQAWAVALLIDNGNGDQIHCSGSIIDPTHIITAAHCFLPKEGGTVNISKLTVVVGANDPLSSNPQDQGTKYKIQSFVMHDKYNSATRAAYYDIAIIKVTEPIEFKSNVWPVCIPERVNNKKNHFERQNIAVIGYGPMKKEDDKNRSELTRSDLLSRNRRFCAKKYTVEPTDPRYNFIQLDLPDKFRNPSVFCAMHHGVGVCGGASGGPVVQFETEETDKYQNPRWVQVATVHGSYGNCDGNMFPSIFVRMDEPDVLRWIYRMLFPDRVDEIDKEDEDDYDY